MKPVSRWIEARLLSSVVLVNLFVYLMAVGALYQSHQRYEESAALSAQNLTRSLAQTVAGVLEKLDIGLSAVANVAEHQWRQGKIDSPQMAVTLLQQKKQLREFEDIWVADSQGDIRWGTQLPAGQPVNIKDRSYFQRQMGDAHAGMVIAEPVMGRITQAWSLLISRRIHHADGSFAGIVLGSLRVEDYFRDMFMPMALGSTGIVTLRGEDMSLYARYGVGDNEISQIGSRQMTPEARESLRTQPQSGNYIATSVLDQIKRVFSYQKVAAFPLYTFVGLGHDESMAPWRKEMTTTAGLLLVFSATTFFFAFISYRRTRSMLAAREAEQYTIEVANRRMQSDLAERKRMEESLRLSEEKYRSLIDQSASIVLEWRPDGTVIYLNPYGLQFFGFTAEEIVGRNVVGTIVAPVDTTGTDLQEKMSRVQEDPDSYKSSENENIRKTGETVWVAWSNKGVYDAQGHLLKTLSFGIDRTGQRQAERQLHDQYKRLQEEIVKREDAQAQLRISNTQLEQRVQERTEALTRANRALLESEAHFRALSDNSLVGIYQHQGGRLSYVNAALARIFGYTTQDLQGMDILRLIAPPDHPRVAERLRQLVGQGAASQFDIRGVRKDGELRDLEIYSVGILLNGKSTVLGTLIDVTERKSAAQKLARAYDDLGKSLEDTIATMAKIVEMRDPYTAGHQDRVARLAVAIAQDMGLPPDRVKRLRMAAMIHDIGKIGIPAEVLSKPGRQTELEYEIIKTHAQLGYEIVSNMNLLPGVPQIIRQHHERMDGSGYPQGLKGDDLLMEARILSVADTIEAMASHRPYRPSLGLEAALAEIEQGRGTSYDPTVCEACLSLFRDKGFALPT